MFGSTALKNEATMSRQNRDAADENSLLLVFQRFGVFSPRTHSELLHNLATKDLATTEIKD